MLSVSFVVEGREDSLRVPCALSHRKNVAVAKVSVFYLVAARGLFYEADTRKY